MTRSATAAALAAMEAEHVPMLAFVEMQFASGTVRVCNAFESVPWNGFTWLGLGNLGTIEPIEESTELQMSGIGLQLSGVNPALIATALGEQYQGRRCNIWFAPLGVDDLATLEFDFAGTRSLVPRFGSATVTFTRAGATATRVNSAGLIEAVAADTARFDFDPLTLACKGLLIEEARTNNFLQSAAFDSASWSKSNSSITANAATAPDGTAAMDKMVENTAASAQHLVSQSASYTNGQKYTVSIWFKAAERVRLAINAQWIGWKSASYNASTGTVVANQDAAVITPSIENWGNGIYRAVFTATCDQVTGSYATEFIVELADGTRFYTGDGVSGIHLWGAQVEPGAFATSYIPTTSAAVTRNSDVARITSLGSWFNAAESAVAAEFIVPATGQYGALFDINDSTQNEQLRGSVAPDRTLNHLVRDGGIVQTNFFTANVLSAGAIARGAWAFKASDFAVTADGGAVATQSSGTMPSPTRVELGSMDVGVFILNSHLRRFTYYNKRLTNAQLEARSLNGPQGYGIIADPIGPFRWRIDTMAIEKGKTATITLTAENRLADWDRARIRRWTDEDQKADYPTDRFFEFIPELQEKEIIF
jgi:hypothetical protein